MEKRKLLLFLWWILVLSPLQGQVYRVEFTEMPLNRALVELRDQYDFRFSFDDRYLSKFSVSVSNTYYSFPELLDALLSGFPLQWEMIGEVYVISRQENDILSLDYFLSGQVLERETRESLPFSHVQINDIQMVTDLSGVFHISSSSDSLFRVRASHLGYFVVDTVLTSGKGHQVLLRPFSYNLPEVVVTQNIVERSVQMGEAPGLIRLNSYIAGYLPGNGDNAVFNLLRLQPGIVAAGEQPNDLIIWGSYEGTSRVKFDGMTIWGLKNFSDNISAVNPFLSKSIGVLKGGYDVTHDDLVGGVVEIAGKQGRRDRPGISVFVNNETINSMVEGPLSEQSSFVVAFRQTYYNLFEPEDIDLAESRDLQYKIDVVPEYRYRDFNVRYSRQTENGNLFFISLLMGDDDFAYSARQERQQNIISQSSSEENHQYGGSMFWSKRLRHGRHIKVQGNWSALNSTYGVRRVIENLRLNRLYERADNKTVTRVEEGVLKIEYEPGQWGDHTLIAGSEMVRNALKISNDSLNSQMVSSYYSGYRFVGFLQDQISLGRNLKLKPGVRMNHSFYASQTIIDPRIELKYQPDESWKLNAAWGIYHQFLVKSSLFDETDNFRYTWSLSNGEHIPVMSSRHWTLGVTRATQDFTVSVEGFYKDLQGFTRYVRYSSDREEIFEGKGHSYGIDLFLKKDFNGNTIWTSYSLGLAEELFPYFPDQEYRRAPHDQRHELKLAGLFHFWKNFHASATYVYGTGFPLYANFLSEKYTEPDYSRLDLALLYRFTIARAEGEAGVSLLNALDNNNVKYSSFEQIPLDQLNTAYIDAEAVTFTPLVFLKLKF